MAANPKNKVIKKRKGAKNSHLYGWYKSHNTCRYVLVISNKLGQK